MLYLSFQNLYQNETKSSCFKDIKLVKDSLLQIVKRIIIGRQSVFQDTWIENILNTQF